MISRMVLCALPAQEVNPSRVVTRIGLHIHIKIRTALCLMVIGACCLELSCDRSGVKTIWSAEVRSPDGHWLASAQTEQHSGFGTGGVVTNVYLKSTKGSRALQLILVLFHNPDDPPRPIGLSMKWAAPSQLVVTYNGRAKVDFEVAKYGDVYISLNNPSSTLKSTAK
jgi:hypothetical protein